MIRITEASFLTSASNINQAPPEECLEVAFLGRSNVGKSSLINALTNRKQLAKKSSTPGKTRLLNFFDIIFDEDGIKSNARFVDLPGFGYAKVSKKEQNEWKENLNTFIAKRVSIRLFILLLDSRHPGLPIDLGVYEYIKSLLRPDQLLLCVYTKSDKLKQNELALLRKESPDAHYVSVLKSKGISSLAETIYTLLFKENL
ncbi:MAG: YihA family ribosome biogenesis GTP-binding protein [Campylobacteraceae bacterium]|nr:YihA family ribosome biogenesis GTP-binding protein [Campylobacteraceae bacterium]